MFLRPSLFFCCSGQALSECQGTIFMPVVIRFTLLTVGTSQPLSLPSTFLHSETLRRGKGASETHHACQFQLPALPHRHLSIFMQGFPPHDVHSNQRFIFICCSSSLIFKHGTTMAMALLGRGWVINLHRLFQLHDPKMRLWKLQTVSG